MGYLGYSLIITSLIYPVFGSWAWGNLHKVVFAHSLSVRPPLDRVFDIGPFPIGGDGDTVCQTAYVPQDPYHNNAWSPSYRQIVDMDDLTRSVSMHTTGQSGHPYHPPYGDMIDPWRNIEYHPMLWQRANVEADAEGVLVLESP